eukprot:TRINITY_DN12111_c0_g1_i1.p1 TRINITY_DN12111_c0_g1~~TRINITY_DN12111_c0_g1_i1.p1  ORF type:complete len:338 (-),score=64.57 TRINITY_DN12111_c0_g1_i1:224-1237(-)
MSASESLGVLDAIGNTPLIHLRSLSSLTGCNIYAKAEHLNPGGSVKDRAAKHMVLEAERTGILQEGGTIVEGTGGNTGVGLAMVAAAKQYKAIFVMPENVSVEKQDAMKQFGAKVVVQPIVPFSDSRHYVHTAIRISQEETGALYTNQFENEFNGMAHYETTGPEIWRQTKGSIDAFVCASGTGGTISGCSRFLKSQKSDVKVVLVDCAGSALYSYIKTGELKAEGSTLAMEGIGIGRMTANFSTAMIDDAIFCSDSEGVLMAYYLLRHEGIWVGPSAALNVAGAFKVAREMGPGKTIVTILCDGGEKYKSKLYSQQWLQEKGFHVPEKLDPLSFIS